MELFHKICNKPHDASGIEYPNNWYWDVDNLKIDSEIYYPVRTLFEDELHEEARDFMNEEGLPAMSLDELMVQTDDDDNYIMSPEQQRVGQILMDMFDNHEEPKVERTLKEEVDYQVREIWMNVGCDRPANHDEIVEYIVSDVEETADPVEWTSGDISIGFRRYIEKDLEL